MTATPTPRVIVEECNTRPSLQRREKDLGGVAPTIAQSEALSATPCNTLQGPNSQGVAPTLGHYTALPAAGETRTHAGRRYTFIGDSRDHVTRSGKTVELRLLSAHCVECGTLIELWLVLPFPTRHCRRRCAACAARYTIKLTPEARRAANRVKDARKRARRRERNQEPQP